MELQYGVHLEEGLRGNVHSDRTGKLRLQFEFALTGHSIQGDSCLSQFGNLRFRTKQVPLLLESPATNPVVNTLSLWSTVSPYGPLCLPVVD